MYKFNAALFAAISAAQGVKDIRYYLNGVHLCPAIGGGAHIVATNGHVLFCAFDPNAEIAEPVTLAIDASAIKAFAKVDGQISLDDGVQLLSLNGKDISFAVIKLEGKFPEWRRVVPSLGARKTPVNTCAATIEYIARLAKLFPWHWPAARFHITGHDASILATHPDFSDRFAVIMPLRAKPDEVENAIAYVENILHHQAA